MQQPLSTDSVVRGAIGKLEKEVRQSKQQRVTEMELSKKRNQQYLPETRRKDIISQRKKIQREAVELQVTPRKPQKQAPIVDECELSFPHKSKDNSRGSLHASDLHIANVGVEDKEVGGKEYLLKTIKHRQQEGSMLETADFRIFTQPP